MTTSAPNNAPDNGRDLTINLSRPWMDQVGDEGVRAYLRALSETVEDRTDDRTVTEVEEELRRRMDAHGLELADLSYSHLAEQIVRSGSFGLSVRDDRGTLLYGRGGGTTELEPGGTDPEHPERPLYS